MAASSSSPCKSPKNSIPVSFNPMYCATRRGSKAQLCFLKILHIISTVRPPQITTAKPPIFSSEIKESYVVSKTGEENNGSEFDLSGDVCVLPEMDESSESLADGRLSPRSTTVGTGDLPSLSGGRGGDQCDQQGKKTHENDCVKTNGVPYEMNGNNDKYCDEAKNKLDLLIEAAKLILGEFKDYDNSEYEKQNIELKRNKMVENEKTLRRRSQWLTATNIGGDIEETGSQVLRRSKRGRTQVLPNRYRDSVLEPLTRYSRHQSSVFPAKRKQ
ncbi:Hypothetical predicted protein [Olea europaea subsp. europaea]|uniref:Uncharacterized protein n=1 Tax=Olea europaea subsp. europaea TaxID=158383 RepID=A0A8S0QC41_OLEEU|nr:Hypothetical predicted protein [Olea europaea subsp. europaea]